MSLRTSRNGSAYVATCAGASLTCSTTRCTALTIHRSEGELSVSDDDLRMLQTAVERFGTPALIDAFAEHVKEYNETPQTE